MGAPPVPEATPAVPIRDSLGAVSQYSAVLMRANTQRINGQPGSREEFDAPVDFGGAAVCC